MSLLYYSKSFIEGEVEEPFSLFMSYCQVLVEISQELGILHVGKPVSRDRRILVMEMEVGKQLMFPIYYLYFDIVFVFQMPFLV